jgi:pimeloyl-ACP methyl ester carboxylesterase
MVLPATFGPDAQAAWDAALAACEADAACSQRFPQLRQDWQRLQASLPREVSTTHPLTGAPETFSLTRATLLNLVRAPLYAPALASALPLAVHEAAQGRFQPLLGLGQALGGGSRSTSLAMGMHFSVVCAEDVPRLPAAGSAAAGDFGTQYTDLYRRVCADWPRGTVPEAFYAMPAARGATLLLSGGADPATPPRHGERVAAALGAQARHVVVPQAGHGVMGIGCMRDVIFRFIDAASDTEALQADLACAQAIPRPGTFLLPQPAPRQPGASS